MRYKIGKERAQGEESRPVPPLRRNLEPTRATHGENLPSEYVFTRRACYEAECNHPVCQIGRPSATDELVWYTGRPSVQFLTLPLPDPKHPRGSNECKNCNGFCTGLFMCLGKVLATAAAIYPHTYPPSTVLSRLKRSFESSKGDQSLELRRCRRTCKANPSEYTALKTVKCG